MIQPVSQPRVILFEEHPLMILGLRTLIEKGGSEVAGAAGDPSAFDALIRGHHPDVAVLDLALYSQGRLEFLRDIKRNHPDLALIVLSVHKEADVAESAINAGASGYLLKVEEPGNLLQAIQTVREGRTYISDHLLKNDSAAPNQPKTPIDLLTPDELEVMKLVGKGYTLKKTAQETGRPLELVERDHWRIRRKLDLEEPEDLLEFAAHWVHHEGGFT